MPTAFPARGFRRNAVSPAAQRIWNVDHGQRLVDRSSLWGWPRRTRPGEDAVAQSLSFRKKLILVDRSMFEGKLISLGGRMEEKRNVEDVFVSCSNGHPVHVTVRYGTPKRRRVFVCPVAHCNAMGELLGGALVNIESDAVPQ